MIGGKENNMSMTVEEEAILKGRITKVEEDLKVLIKNFILLQTNLIKIVQIIQVMSGNK